ncbi:MAG: LysE family translocator [Alphaproteobacteria bacterium]|nr:LysE family translocator [Alphaproteobacteria bacterium]
MPELLVSLILVAVATTITPGPGTLLAAAAGARFGFQRTVPLLAGVAGGLAALMAAATVGLAALLQSVPALQTTMKVSGSAYLFWLALRIGRSGAPAFKSDAADAPMGLGAGLMVLWLNPKAWTMAFGVASAYAGIAADPLQLALLLSAVFGGTAALALSLWCAGGIVLGRTLQTAGQWRAANAALGLLTAASIIPLWL